MAILCFKTAILCLKMAILCLKMVILCFKMVILCLKTIVLCFKIACFQLFFLAGLFNVAILLIASTWFPAISFPGMPAIAVSWQGRGISGSCYSRPHPQACCCCNGKVFLKKFLLLKNCFSALNSHQGGLLPQKIPTRGNNSIFCLL